jgi:hypothetical protein
MKNASISLALLGISLLGQSCQKTEGPGGTSVITGFVTGSEYDAAEAETTEIIVSAGAEIEHGEYWILNTPAAGTFYYVWYDNPTWAPNGDPQLEGRTGIPVVYNYSDSNVEIAQATLAAVQPVLSADFTITLSNDVLLLTNKIAGYVPDANNMTSPFEFNIAQQGKDETLGTEGPAVDERVYLVYGDNTTYGESVRTGGDGEFEFKSLTAGSYTVYVLSDDSTGQSEYVKQAVVLEITENKSTVDAGTLEVLH